MRQPVSAMPFAYPSQLNRTRFDQASHSPGVVKRPGSAMNHPGWMERWTCISRVLVITGSLFCSGLAFGQGPVSTNLQPRDLAPGVLTIIPPDQNAGDTAIGPVDLPFVEKHPELAWSAPDFENGSPNFGSPSETLVEMGKGITFRHAIWGLEFAFKPVRTIEADVPTKAGRFEKKLVWYMVYRLRYVGGDLLPDVENVEAGLGVAKEPKKVVFRSVRFLPLFTLIDPHNSSEYRSQILTTVIPEIEARERVGQPLLDEIQISRRDIKPSVDGEEAPVWGVVTWVDVASDIDFFMVQVRGLSNAYQLDTTPTGDSNFRRKTLQIYFWRPGDTIAQKEDRIRLGIPAFIDKTSLDHMMAKFGGAKKRLAYEWLYR